MRWLRYFFFAVLSLMGFSFLVLQLPQVQRQILMSIIPPETVTFQTIKGIFPGWIYVEGLHMEGITCDEAWVNPALQSIWEHPSDSTQWRIDIRLKKIHIQDRLISLNGWFQGKMLTLESVEVENVFWQAKGFWDFGSCQGEILLTGENWGFEGPLQWEDGKLQSSHLTLAHPLLPDGATIKGAYRFADQVLVVDGHAKTLAATNQTLQDIDVHVQGTPSLWALTGQFGGPWGKKKARVSLSGSLDQLERLKVEDLRIPLENEEIRLLDPVWLLLAPTFQPEASVHFQIGKGTVTLDLRKAEQAYDFLVSRVPLKALNLMMGKDFLQGVISAKGSLSPTQYTGHVEVSDLKITPTAPSMVLEGDIEGDWQHVVWDAKMSHAASFTLKTKGRLDTASQALDAIIQGPIQLAWANAFVPPIDRIQGVVSVDLTLKGSLKAPAIAGHIALRQGLYENGFLGLILRDIHAEGTVHQSVITLKGLYGKDTGRGTIQGGGTIRIGEDFVPTFDLSATVTHVRAAQTDFLQGLADGTLWFKGTGTQTTFGGDLAVSKVNVAFSLTPPSKPLRFTKTQKKKTKLTIKSSAPVDENFFPIKLNLNPTQPVNLKGYGLVSTWTGGLVLKGATADAYLVGELLLARGYFEFLNKKLKLTEGRLIFDSQAPNDPHINILAMRESAHLSVGMQLTGRASYPETDFKSTPSLPREEVLSRLLFDKSVGNISSTQSLQLASAIAALQPGAGLNIFQTLENVFGLDAIEIQQTPADSADQPDNTTVRLGKQISDTVYLHYDQAMGAGPSKVGVEMKVSPHFSVDADVGDQQNVGFGLNWSKRY